MARTERELNAAERSLLLWLVENGRPEAAAFRPQVERARVIGSCDCGCRSVNLSVPGQAAAAAHASVIAAFHGASPEGVRLGVLLHARQGRLSELEVFSLAGVERSFSLPRAETLVSLTAPAGA